MGAFEYMILFVVWCVALVACLLWFAIKYKG